MTSIFVLHTLEDAVCAETIRTDLEAKGYRVWRKPESMQISDILYPRTIETSILGSAAVILVWSSSAAQSTEVEQHLLLAQHLKKLLIPIVLDGTSLPNTLVAVSSITQTSCMDVITQLIQQLLLPPPQNDDSLIALSERAAHEHIGARKAAIDQAAEMLQRSEQREAVLALLEYLAEKDQMTSVRNKAQEAIDADAQRQMPKPLFSFNSDDARHIFGVCCKNGHITYFNKNKVCKEQSRIVRRGEPELDELELKCGTCGEIMRHCTDCEGYK